MDISVITPVYYGNKYLNNYMKMMGKAAKKFTGANHHIEVILVNDSPEVEIEYDRMLVQGFEVCVLENEKNVGIHASRVNGLRKSSGEYIIFLDQDDKISANCFETHAQSIGDADISLGNGILEIGNQRNLIFGGKFSQKFASKEWVYLWIRDFIVSPGQCMIKKASIPEYWKENCLHSNGTDDYLLWLLMFREGCTMRCNYHAVYMHCDTGENLSSDAEKMLASTEELLKTLEKYPGYKKSFLKLVRRRIYYKLADRSNKKQFIIKSIRNIDILLVNIFYRIVWRGCLISQK